MHAQGGSGTAAASSFARYTPRVLITPRVLHGSPAPPAGPAFTTDPSTVVDHNFDTLRESSICDATANCFHTWTTCCILKYFTWPCVRLLASPCELSLS